MSSNDPSDDIQPPSPITNEPRAEAPSWQADVDLPPRPLVQTPPRPHPNFLWSLLWCLLFLVVTQLPGAVVAGVIIVVVILAAPQLLPPGAAADTSALMKSSAMSAAMAVAFFITEVLVVGFSLLVIRLVVGRDWTRQLALRRPGVAHTILALASLPALVLVGNVAYDFFRNVLHVPSMSDWGIGGMEEMVQIFSKWPWSFAVLVIGLGPGVGEELWCRGFLGRGLVGNYGPILGVVAASFFFGLIHIDPCQGLMAVLMGLWLHFVYLTTRSLWLPMLLHFLNNSFAVLAPRFAFLKRMENVPDDNTSLIYLSMFLLLAATAYALYQSRARLAPRTPEEMVLWRPTWVGVEYPPPNSGAKIVHPTPSPAAWLFVSVALWMLIVGVFSNWKLLR